jgi:dTMP kinase
MKRAKYICFEGTEGVGKTTHSKKLYDYLREQGYTVLLTKEPGTPLVPLTMTLRNIMLDNKFDDILTKPAREFISQAIRSIHLERVIVPALTQYDYIIQDRGILSGYAYGSACGNDISVLRRMATQNIDAAMGINAPRAEGIYDMVIYLKGDPIDGLLKAKMAKQEFETGDAMESRGDSFIAKASANMDQFSSFFNTVRIEVNDRPISEVHSAIINALNM